MPFDPDAYLAKKTGGSFDPDAYLRSKRTPGRQPLTPEQQAKVDRTTKAGLIEPPGFMDKLRAAWSALESGESADSMDAYASRATDVASLGAIPWLAEKVVSGSAEAAAAAQARNPIAAQVGNIGGLGLSMAAGPARAAGAAGANVAGALGRVAPSVAGRVAGAAAGGAVAGGLYEGADAAARGGDLADVGERAQEGAALGAAFAAPFAIAGEAAGGVSKLLRRDPWIGRYARAKETGAYKDPAMKALPKGPEGIQAAAEKVRPQVMARDEQLVREGGQRYAAEVDPLMGQPADAGPMRRRLLEKSIESRNSNFDTTQKGKVQRAIKSVTDDIPPEPQVSDLLAARRNLKERSGYGQPAPTDDQRLNRELYQAIKNSLGETAAADDAYAAVMRQAGRRRDILARSEDQLTRGSALQSAGPDDVEAVLEAVPPNMRVNYEQAIARNLKRIGDTNEPGMAMASYLDELAAQDEVFAKALDFVAAKKALEATRFAVRGALPTSLSGATALAGVANSVGQNARAIGARVIDPAAAGLARELGAGRQLSSIGAPAAGNPILQAIEDQQKRSRSRWETFAGRSR